MRSPWITIRDQARPLLEQVWHGTPIVDSIYAVPGVGLLLLAIVVCRLQRRLVNAHPESSPSPGIPFRILVAELLRSCRLDEP